MPKLFVITSRDPTGAAVKRVIRVMEGIAQVRCIEIVQAVILR